jgi:hypothetical protein
MMMALQRRYYKMNPFICNHSRLMVIITVDERQEKCIKKICASCGLDRSDVSADKILNHR